MQLIDAYFDFICPWCLIGKSYLQQAVQKWNAQQPQQLQIRWLGVQLLPDIPAQGLPFLQFYRQRLGSDAAMQQRMWQVQLAAQQAGLELDLSSIRTMPNTAMAHHLFAKASAQASAEQTDLLLNLLLQAYFQQQADISTVAGLTKLALAAGFSTEQSKAWLDSAEPIWSGTAEYSRNINQVPSFRLGDNSISGAQSVAALEHWFRQCFTSSSGLQPGTGA